MPRKRWIDKSNATTFQLVHRPQNDPRIHDEDSSSMVFRELAPSQAHKIKNRGDLETELFGGSEGSLSDASIRDNEGEAAEHGIYFDDTQYDYMQHMRNLDSSGGNGESHFVEAFAGNKRNGKKKLSLEEALRQSNLEDEQSEAGGSRVDSLLEESESSQHPGRNAYQSQQDVPDEISGFQPDMDPRLREVLEALEDEAYVDDEEDFFGEITKDQNEVSLEEFEDNLYNYDDDDENEDWESDTTEKPTQEYQQLPSHSNHSTTDTPDTQMSTSTSPPPPTSTAWLSEYQKFKAATTSSSSSNNKPPQGPHPSHLKAPIDTTSTLNSTRSLLTAGGTRHKKRKGALTSSTSYSMTSSSLARTEGQTLLDLRFDKMEESYADDNDDTEMLDREEGLDDDDGVSVSTHDTRASVTSSQSQAPMLMSGGFEGMMDEFLDGFGGAGVPGGPGGRRKKGRKGGAAGIGSGMAELDEVRKGLGPARVGKRMQV